MDLDEAQNEWDIVTNLYSRRPSAENWQKFLECKRIVLSLREEAPADEAVTKCNQLKLEASDEKMHQEGQGIVKDSLTPVGQKEIKETVDSKIYDFLKDLYPQIMESKDIVKGCHITRHQMRHGLLKLLKQKKIEKTGTGFYQAIKE